VKLPSRFPALDGLRGVAALIVLIHHCSMVIPAMASAYYVTEKPPAAGSIAWFFSYTPLKILTAGSEAVVLFFVLSGLVLALAPLNARRDGDRFDWLAYFPRRVIRLYLPTIASIALAVVVILLVPRDTTDVHGPWLRELQNAHLSVGAALQDATIVVGAPFRINPPMWSLVWEVWFSLLLPAMVVVVIALKRLWWVGIPVAIWATFAGSVLGNDWLSYLPIFLIGVSLACGYETLRAQAERIDARRAARAIWVILTVLGLLLLIGGWLMRGVLADSWVPAAAALPLASVGATLLVFVAAFGLDAGRLLTRRPVAWLGRVSFSLYLVHLPIVLAVAYLVGDERPWLVAAFAIPLSLGVAELFSRWVEQPAHRLAKRVGDRVAAARATRVGAGSGGTAA
jgi:peptidoglycan/LPS O-acetylase OafA/YrhL